MIEPDTWILTHASDLGVDPARVNPASVDVTLGSHIIERRQDDDYLLSNGDEFVFMPGCLYICHTNEYTRCPPTHAWMLILKSSAGRRGLDHAHSGWGDPGFEGQITFEFTAHIPVTYRIGDPIAQLVYMRLAGVPSRTYAQTGRYQGQRGATLER